MYNTKEGKSCVIYIRVSSERQVKGYSLDGQKHYLAECAERRGMTVLDTYVEEGKSGKSIEGRTEFQRMLDDIQSGKVHTDYVLVFKLSRFGRNARDVLNSLEFIMKYGVHLMCVEDGLDSSTSMGKMMITILGAVAELERENIIAQSLLGREEKAKSGGWNGGFAPYGYRLENGELSIADEEVEVIRVIFDRFIHTNDGVAGIARYLNTHGYVKKLRQNGTIPKFSAVFVRGILDNPIYCGKIAFGRRKVEKKLGTRNEMHVVKQSEFPVYVGQHEAIVSEDDWNLAQTKRQRTTGRREKVRDPDHAHILSGILKCPCCGRNLYGNVSKAHSKDNKTRYYYFCKSIKGQTGHECSFRLNIEQNEINQMVASIVSAMVHNPRFVDAIKEKISSAVDTSELEHQADTIKAQLRQRLNTKFRLEHQMDTLDFNDPYYDRKSLDLQRRYDEQYELIGDMESQLAEIQGQIDDIHQEKITADNIYHLLLAFDEVYNAATEVEQKEFMRAFIERIDIFPKKQPDGNWIRNIVFAFPVPYNGKEIREFPLESQSTVECVLLMSKVQ